jgi:5-methylthioribose kinase
MRAYTRYREPRGALVHGDVQAGNVLLPTAGGVKLLDAEIAHVGDPAFDVGMLLAHVLLAGLARDALGPAAEVACTTWNAYASSATAGDAPELADVARYAGIEILRRTIGAARVAAVADTRVALAALDVATDLIRTPAPGAVELVRRLSARTTAELAPGTGAA